MPVRPPWGRTYICGSPSAGSPCSPAEGTCPIIIGPKGVERSSRVCVQVSSPSSSRQHVAVIPPSPCLHLYRHSAKLPAPQGSHYSIAAGERSEPAEGACPHHHRPQGGRTPIAYACVGVVPVAIPAACRCDTAVPCLHLCSRCAKLPAPQGSHYSVTAGSPCSPAEGACPHHHRPQGGRTLIVCACECPALASLG